MYTMKGTWKENVGGYAKDNKRKKQSRKHSLNDSAKWHINHSKEWRIKERKISSAIRIEGAIEIIPDTVKVKKELYVKLYKVDVDNYDYEKSDYLGGILPAGFFEGNVKLAFKYKNRYYDFYTKEVMEGVISPLSWIDTIYLDWDESLPKEKKDRSYWSRADSTETLHLWGKPLPVDYWCIFGCYSTKRRKYAQKKVNGIDRMNVKTFIRSADWDKEIRTHALSKSIAWEIS